MIARGIVSSLIIFLCTAFTICRPAEGAIRLPPSPTVVVADFGRYGGHNSSLLAPENLSIIGSTAAELVTHHLLELSPFDLVSYDLEAVANEISLTSTGVMSGDSLREFALIHDARYVIYGTVADISYGENSTIIPFVGVSSDKITSRITIQLFDSQTGDILMTAQGTGVSEAASTSVGVIPIAVTAGTSLGEDNIHKSLDKAAKNAVELLLKRIYGEKIPKRKV